MKITKQQLKKIIKEELKKTLYRDLHEELTDDQAKNAVGLVLTYLESQAPIRVREPQGYIYSGIVSVNPQTGEIGVQVADTATYVSHLGGPSSNYKDEQQKINPDDATSELFNHMGLQRDLKKFGLSIGSFDETAPLKFSFSGAMNRDNQFGGYRIEIAQ